MTHSTAMKIVIIGDNLTAQAAAKALLQASNDITLVGENQKNLKTIALQANIQTVCGQYTDAQTLAVAECADAALVVAATSCSTTNFLLAQMANKIFQVPTIISLLSDNILSQIDTLCPPKETPAITWINLDKIIGNNILNCVHHPQYLQYYPITTNTNIVCITATNSTKQSSQSWLKENIDPANSQKIIAAIRDNSTIIQPKYIHPEDLIVLLCTTTDCPLNPKTHIARKIEQIMIVGITTTTEYIIEQLYHTHQLTVIETNLKKAADLAQKYGQVTILEGDINDTALLVAEGLDTTDAFLALSSDDENNLISALQASSHQVKCIFTCVTKAELSCIVKKNALFCIEPHTVLVSQVLKAIYYPTLQHQVTLLNNQGGVIICTIHAHLSGKTIAYLQQKLPSNCTICFIHHGETATQARAKKILREHEQITIAYCAQTNVHELINIFMLPEQHLFFSHT